ncbi:MAG: type II secretion system F family protein [Actinobacteria bacterium]|nr:type II secretion system F family protein [Actinomycetota bacterium]
MSSLLLPFALVATFGSVVLVGMTVEAVLARRRRPVEMLEAQVAAVHGSTDLREQELARSFLERALLPLVGALGGMARRITPEEMRRRIAHKLALAGSPAGWDAEKVAAFKVFGSLGGAVTAYSLSQIANRTGGIVLVAVGIGVGVGWLIPGAWLGQAAARRQDEIARALPDTMDLLTISVEAGLGFDAALAQVIRNVPGTLSQEIARMLQEMQLGVTRVDAFRNLASRTDVEELRGFTLAMIQADIFGVSIAGVLRAQAKELRVKRRQRAERKAMTTPLKLLFPMIFCVLPALFVVVLGPGAIRVAQNFFGG